MKNNIINIKLKYMLVGFLLIIVTVEADTIAELFSKLKSESSKDYYAARGQIISQKDYR